MAVIEYYYSAHSAFAYLGSARLTQICAIYDVTLIHKPITLSPVIAPQGALPFAERTQAQVDYFFGREIERWAEFREVPIISYRPTYHDADYTLANGMIAALGDTGAQVDAMAHALLEAHWRDDVDLSSPVLLSEIASRLGHAPMALLARAASTEVKSRLRTNDESALAAQIFGSPTYIVDGDPFYGQDRLEMVERALGKPFKQGTWSNPPVTTT